MHVTAVWRRAEDRLTTLRICEATPPSETDRFALALARARADAIVTTGRILREEPQLDHGLELAGDAAGALAAWRRERLGRGEPPWSAVLTSGRDLDPGHRLFAGPTRPLVLTSAEGARRLEGVAAGGAIEVAVPPEPGVRGAVAFLLARGCRTVSIEAGPSTSAELYRSPLLVDELLLSIYEEPHLDDAVRGRDFLPLAELEAQLGAATRVERRNESGARWSFRRMRRAASPARTSRAAPGASLSGT